MSAELVPAALALTNDNVLSVDMSPLTSSMSSLYFKMAVVPLVSTLAQRVTWQWNNGRKYPNKPDRKKEREK